MKRRTLLTIVMILYTIFSQAQKKNSHPGITSFGLRGGINFQNINGKNEKGDKLKNKILSGFNIGITTEIPVAPEFYIQPGLLFTVKGAKTKEAIPGQLMKGTIKISYVELPFTFLYKPLLGNGHMLLGFGPYIAFGAGGKVKYEGGGLSQSSSVKFKNTIKVTDPDNVVYFKSLDAGVNMLAGFECSNKISFQLNTQLGLTRINPEYEGASNDKTSAKNTGFGFSLGYRL